MKHGEPPSAVIWRWDAPKTTGPTAVAMRRHGVIRALVGALVAGLAASRGHVVAAAIAGGVAALVLALALASPLGGYRAIDAFAARSSVVVGRVVTWLVLTPFFYLVVTPFAVLRRLAGADPLGARLERDRASYWVARDEAAAKDLERPY